MKWLLPMLLLCACAEGTSGIRSRVLPTFEEGRYRTIAYADGELPDGLIPFEGALAEDLRTYAPGLFRARGYQPPQAGFQPDLLVRVARTGSGGLQVDVLEASTEDVVWTGSATSYQAGDVQALRDTLDLVLVGIPKAATRPVAY
ncbi:MAG: DUF4136 domain-containing protein [Myxococcota bacterium]